MTKEFKPMLAGTPKDASEIPLPCIVSPKLDGIRAPVKHDQLLSRSLKLIPNKLIQSVLGAHELHGLDGELIVGPANAPNVMQATTSVVMSIEKREPFEYHVFDYWDHAGGFQDRLAYVAGLLLSVQKDWRQFVVASRLLGAPREIMQYLEACPIKLVPHKLVTTLDELDAAEAEYLADGYEGMMVRAPQGGYKYGRSTVKEGGLLKLKRFSDGEAVIVGFEEEMKNGNVAQTNELGRTKRSTAKAGLTGKGTLGAFVCRQFTPEKGVFGPNFNIGTGMTAEFRASVWANRESFMNKIVKFKHFEHGVVDAPRHPVFLGFRDKRDM